MGIKQLEAAILAELKEVTGNKRIRQKDIMEWETGATANPSVGRGEELTAWLPKLMINVAYISPK